MKKVIILFIVIAGISGKASGQNLDSLWKVYANKSQSDTNRLNTIHAITNFYYANNNPDSTIIMAELEMKLANSLDDNKGKKWMGKALNMLGLAYSHKGNYIKALEYLTKAAEIRQEMGNKEGVLACYTNIGGVYYYQSNYPKALEYFLKALQLSQEIGDKAEIGNCFTNLGAVYKDESNYDKALEYSLKSLQIHKELGNKQGMGSCYNNIGVVYYHLSQYAKALEYYSKSINIAEAFGNKIRIGNCYANMGSVYFDQLNYPMALQYFLKALHIRREIGDMSGVANCYIDIGGLYNATADFTRAIQYSDSALQVCRETKDINNERLAYQHMASAYSKTGKYKEAYESHVKFKQLTDSIFNADNSKQLGDLKTNFEVEKKEAELKIKAEAQEAITKEEKQKQQFVIYAVASVLLIVMAFSVFLFRRFKITKKQKHIIELQKDEVSRQKYIVEQQKNIVEEHQKEIIDSINYAERIQRSFMATKEILDENLNDYFVFFKPKDIVSGDFYWASKLNNGNFALATADSTGHGVPGAIMSLLNVTSLEKAVETHTQPSEILNATRKIIIERLKKDGSAEGGKDGMDASLTVYDFKNKKLVIAAANNPVWIIRGTETIEIKPDKMPVGKHDRQDLSFTQQEVDLQAGDVVYTLTDGFPDQFGGDKGKKFMSKKLRELLSANAHLAMNEQMELLERTFTTWIGSMEQVDDVTLLGVRI